jgi:hypothetical protein
MRGKLYKTNGEIEEVEPENGEDFKLAELQKMVEGNIEIVPLDKSEIIVVNEEGKLEGLPANGAATRRWREAHGPTDVIVGNALVCDGSMVR